MNELELLRRIQDLERRADRQDAHSHLSGWKDYASTPTGWSGTPTVTFRYFAIGKTILFTVLVDGTSNSASAYLSLPFTAASVNGWGAACNYTIDNGTPLAAPARWSIDNAQSVVNFYTEFTGTGWTASGRKLIAANGFYQIP